MRTPRTPAGPLLAFFVALAATLTLTSPGPAALEQAGDQPADVLIVNGRVYAGGGAFHEAVATRGATILAVGRTGELQRLRGPRTEVIDARGRAVVPGFNDSHVHFVDGGFALQDVDLSGITALREVQARIAAFATAKPAAAWVKGRGWLYAAFPGGLPTRRQLDEVVPDRPALMECYDGHSVWVNSKALQLAGITKDTPDPTNGVIVRDPQTGEPTGLLKEAAQSLLDGVVPRPTDAERRAALRAAVAEAHRLGVTSVQNANGSAEDLRLYAAAKDAGELTVRMYPALSISPGFTEADADRLDALRAEYGTDDPVLRTGIVKIMSDGVIESRTAAMLAPYAGSSSSGSPNYSADELNRIVALLDRRGWQIEVHAIGDRAVRMTLDAFERAAAANPAPARGRRHRIEHIETIAPADVPRFGRLGVIASQQPMHVVLGDMNAARPSGPWPDNVGRERAARAWNWKGILDAGGRATFGSDWYVATLDPLQGVWVLTTRVSAPGMQDQRLSMREAIDGYTAWPAYASFEEHRKGTLAPGLLADLAVLSRDIFAQPPVRATDIVADVTIFSGRIVHRR
jgi:hypothetical protein